MGKISNVVIYTNKISKNMHLLVVSDIHATKTSGYKNLTKIKDIMSTEPIDHIIIPGDIVDDVESLKDYNFQKKLQYSLLEFTQEKPTIISYGNHDQMTKKDGIWQEGNKQLLKDTLSPLPNYHLLENGEIFKTDEITYSALSPDFNFYEGKDKTKKERESDEAYQEIFYSSYYKDLFNKKEFNIFLTHAPQAFIRLSKKKGSCIVPNTDMAVSGHMHNGLLPNFLGKYMHNRGIISPQMQLFPDYAQGKYQQNDTTYVINGPVNAMVGLPIVNDIYGPNATVVTLVKKR